MYVREGLKKSFLLSILYKIKNKIGRELGCLKQDHLRGDVKFFTLSLEGFPNEEVVW